MKDLVIGIDIGGTNTDIGIVDKNGNILVNNSISTNKYFNTKSYVDALHNEITASINSIKENHRIKGIGIGAPNGNHYTGKIEFAPNLNWGSDFPIVSILSEKTGLPVVLTNDANAAAMGELIYGAAKGMKNIIVITLGTGLGSGFVINGKLVYGNDGFAGELGHVIVKPNGRKCKCGRRGCLETYVSATGIRTTAIKYIKSKKYNSNLDNIDINKLTSKDIFVAAQQGDKLALDAFDFTAKKLGIQLANTVAITNPEAIFLFGGLALSREYILKPTKVYMEENMLKLYKNKVKLQLSSLMDKNAAILGAAALI